MFDPLYNWSLTPEKAYKIQYGREPGPALRKQWDKSAEESKGQKANKLAERALLRVTHKLNGMEEGSHLSVQGQVNQRNLIIARKEFFYIIIIKYLCTFSEIECCPQMAIYK